MPQDFPSVADSVAVRDGREPILARDEALRSMFSGTAFPTTPAPVAGQMCFRTDLGGRFVFDGAAWRGASPGRQFVTNASMETAQRYGNTATAIAGSVTFPVDRWGVRAAATPTGTLLAARVASGLSRAASESALRISRTAGSYAGAIDVGQPFETAESKKLAGRSVEVRVSARRGAGFGGTLTIAAVTGTGSDQGVAALFGGTWTGQASALSQQITPATAWTDYRYFATIPANATQIGLVATVAGFAGTAGATDWLEFTDATLTLAGVDARWEPRDLAADQFQCRRFARPLRIRRQLWLGDGNVYEQSDAFDPPMRREPGATLETLNQTANNVATFPQVAACGAGAASVKLAAAATGLTTADVTIWLDAEMA